MLLNPDADPWSPVVNYPMLPYSFYYPPSSSAADFNLAAQPPPYYYQLPALLVPFQQPVIHYQHVPFPYYQNDTTTTTTTYYYSNDHHHQQQQHQPNATPGSSSSGSHSHNNQNHEIMMMTNHQNLNNPSSSHHPYYQKKVKKSLERGACSSSASGERNADFGYFTTPPRDSSTPTSRLFTASPPARVVGNNTKVMMWKLKKTKPPAINDTKENCGSSIIAEEQNLVDDQNNKTSIMIRNIPNHFRREALLRFLDFYCINHQLAYDFFYLPMDFMSPNNNLGYAFVNFTTSDAASKVMSLLEGHKWNDTQSQLHHGTSTKICQVTWARIQGQEELKKNFHQSKFCCNELDYLPVEFSPPRNGSTCLSNPSTIGIMRGNHQLQHQRHRKA